MRYAPPQEYSVNEPERLGLELTLLTDQTDAALRQLESERAARWRVRRIRGASSVASFSCSLDELLVINTEDAAVKIVLPKLGPLTQGRAVAYARHDVANALTFEGSNGAQVNGAATFTAAAAVGRGVDLINDGLSWWTA